MNDTAAALQAELMQIYRAHQARQICGYDGQTIGRKAKAMRLWVEAMTEAGHPTQQAWAMAHECNRQAQREADSEALLRQLGVSAAVAGT